MSSPFYLPKLGILGGGQLGRMLVQAAIPFGLDTAVLDPDTNAPCAGLTPQFIQGDLMNFETVYAFGKTVDILTIEFEHINTDALAQLESEGTCIYPQPHVIKTIQDKGLQKLFYKHHHIPTAPFKLISAPSELKNYPELFPAIQKTRTHGYDGKGVCSLPNINSLETAFTGLSVLEKHIDIHKEFALSIARNKNGDIALFPAVDLHFHAQNHILDTLFCPSDLDPNVLQTAQDIATTLITELNLIGLLAIEFFLCQDGSVLVNEIAPRPHNSGHHTLEGTKTSQFSQLIRAVLNLPLGVTDITKPSAMINLLGSDQHPHFLEKCLKIPEVYVHLYGKKQSKPLRKMGHITVLANTKQDLQTKIAHIKEWL